VNEWQVAECIVYRKDWTSRKALVGHVINITRGKYQVHNISYMGHAVVQLFDALHYGRAWVPFPMGVIGIFH